jgi:RNA polymerase sigma-70 factor (ECF subfamily)
METALQFVEEARRGKPEALEALIGVVWKDAYRIAAGILRDRALAEDAAQEACAALYRGIARLRSTAAFRVWFYRIVVRESLAVRRLSAVRHINPDHFAFEEERSVARMDVARALGLLSPVQRAVVVLQFYAGLSSREAGAVLGMPAGSVRFHSSRARRQLEAALNGDSYASAPPVVAHAH